MRHHPRYRRPHREAEVDRPLDPVHVFHSRRIAVHVCHHVVILERHWCLARTRLDLRPHLAVPSQQALHCRLTSLDERDQDVHDRRQHVGLGLPALTAGKVYGARGHVALQEAGRHLGEEVLRQVSPLRQCQSLTVVAEVATQ